MMDDSLTEELERLKAENERLPRARGRTVSLKISEKGGVSVSGLDRFPVTLYKEQWTTFFDMTDEIRAFLTEHGAALQTKSKAEQPGRSTPHRWVAAGGAIAPRTRSSAGALPRGRMVQCGQLV